MSSLVLFLPELSLLITIAIFLLMACLPCTPRRNFHMAAITALIIFLAALASTRLNGELFNGAYRIDLYSQIVKFFLALGFLLVVLLCKKLNSIDIRYHSEFYLLLAVSTLAMMMMVSGAHLLTIFLALELSSYSLYILVFLRNEPDWGMVSGLRFFLTGATISAIMLFGMAVIYSQSGTLSILALTKQWPSMMTKPIATTGLFLIMAGFFFKLALFPFHTWAPDTYEGAPNQVATFIATVSKLAAVSVLLRIIAISEGHNVLLAKGLIAISIASMTIGNLSAITQKDFKRLMAFSSIAHAGYILIGILCMTPDAYHAVLFYGIAVLIMKFTCFMVMVTISGDGKNLQISELAGLHQNAPVLALALMLALFGLAGIPPTIGFTGKFLIFTAAIQKGYLGLVILAMLNVVISLYYYLMVLKAAYIDEPSHNMTTIKSTLTTNIMAFGLIVVIIVIGFYPKPLVMLVQTATSALLR